MAETYEANEDTQRDNSNPVDSTSRSFSSISPSSSASQALIRRSRTTHNGRGIRGHGSEEEPSLKSSQQDHLQSKDPYQNWIDDLPLPIQVHRIRHRVLTSAVSYLDRKLGGKEDQDNLYALAKDGLEAEIKSLERALERRKSESRSRNGVRKQERYGDKRSRSHNPPTKDGVEDQVMADSRGVSVHEDLRSNTDSTLGLIDRSSKKQGGNKVRFRSTLTSDAGIIRRVTGLPLGSNAPRTPIIEKSSPLGKLERLLKFTTSPPNSADSRVKSGWNRDYEDERPRLNPDSLKSDRKVSRDSNRSKSHSRTSKGSLSSSKSQPPKRSNLAPVLHEDEPPHFSLAKGLRQYVQEVVRWELGRHFHSEPSRKARLPLKEDHKSDVSRSSNKSRQYSRSAQPSTEPTYDDGHKRPVERRRDSDDTVSSEASTPRQIHIGVRVARTPPNMVGKVSEGVSSSVRASDKQDQEARRTYEASQHTTTAEPESQQTTSSRMWSIVPPSTGMANVGSRSAPGSRIEERRVHNDNDAEVRSM